jgi:TRAP-type C4-dicarboxylate transport system permease small subunit
VTALLQAYRVFGHLKLAGAALSGVAVFGLMLFIVTDVFRRNVLGASIPGSFEIAQNYFLPLAVFPAIGWVYASGILPKMDLLMPRTGERVQAVTVYALLVVELFVFAVLTYYTWGFATTGMERRQAFPAGGSLYPLWPLLFLVPFGFACVLVETLFVLLRNLLGRRPVALSMTTLEEVPPGASPAPSDI